MGRKTKLNEETQTAIAAALRLGYYQEQAATMAGIASSTYYDWLKKGTETEDNPEPKEPFAGFAEAVLVAQAEGEGYLIGIIREAAASTWTAAAWLLERKYPARWARKERVEVSGSSEEPIILKLVWPEHADS